MAMMSFGEGDVEIHVQSLQVVGPCSKTSRPKFQHRPPLTRKIKDLSLLGWATSSAGSKTGTEQLLVLEIAPGRRLGVSLFPPSQLQAWCPRATPVGGI